MMQLRSYADVNELNERFASEICSMLSQAIEARGRAYLVVSGGKTPAGLFKTLAKAEQLAWDRVTITLADERWLPPSDKDSNEHLVRASLLQGAATQAEFISLYAKAMTVNETAFIVNERLSTLPVFDGVILGMGEDGHTASLFPCSSTLSEALSTEASVVAVRPETAPYERISLSLARLLKTRNIYLQLVGEKKLAALALAKEGVDPMDMPIRAFIHHPEINLQVRYTL